MDPTGALRNQASSSGGRCCPYTAWSGCVSLSSLLRGEKMGSRPGLGIKQHQGQHFNRQITRNLSPAVTFCAWGSVWCKVSPFLPRNARSMRKGLSSASSAAGPGATSDYLQLRAPSSCWRRSEPKTPQRPSNPQMVSAPLLFDPEHHWAGFVLSMIPHPANLFLVLSLSFPTLSFGPVLLFFLSAWCICPDTDQACGVGSLLLFHPPFQV